MLSVTNYSYIRTHVQQQAGNSAQHWSTVVLPINTVTDSQQQVPGYWLTGLAMVGGQLVSLKSRVIQQGYCEYWQPHGTAVWRPHTQRAVARLKYI